MPNILRGLSHTFAALTANCGDFHAAWEAASQSPGAGERWEGEWRSQVNAHQGALRCVLRRHPDGRFDAMFHARYARFLRVCYTAPLHATPAGASFRLEGQADLGALAGGVYSYRGDLAPGKLTCSYECRYDRGTFDLQPAKGL